MSGPQPFLDRDVGPDVKIRLEVAARLEFPDGSIGLSALRREAARGRLTVWRIANKDMTTLTEVRKMVDRCLRAPSQPAFGSDRPETAEPRLGSSSTADVNSALAAARLRVKRLSESLKSTSAQSATRQPAENVVRIKPR